MSTIRDMTAEDLPQVMRLAVAMLAESRFAAKYPIAEAKLQRMIQGLIDSADGAAWVADDGGEIVGGFLGVAIEQWFSHAWVAQDLAMFVSPDKRGSMIGVRFVRLFQEWANTRGCQDAEIGVNTGVAHDRTGDMLKACGMEPVGTLYSRSV